MKSFVTLMALLIVASCRNESNSARPSSSDLASDEGGCDLPPTAEITVARAEILSRIDWNGMTGYLKAVPVREGEGGVKLFNVPRRSLFKVLRLCPGDTAISLGGKHFDRIEDVGELRKLLKDANALALRMQRKNTYYEIVVRFR